MELQISQTDIDRLLAEFEKGFQGALIEITVAEGLVCDDPASCQNFVEALDILVQAGNFSDTASLAAGLSKKALTEAHRTAVGPDPHSDGCSLFASG